MWFRRTTKPAAATKPAASPLSADGASPGRPAGSGTGKIGAVAPEDLEAGSRSRGGTSAVSHTGTIGSSLSGEAALPPAVRVPSWTGAKALPPPSRTYDRRHEEAARTIGAATRGAVTRHHVTGMYYVEARPTQEPIDPLTLGLPAYAESNADMPTIADHIRYGVRDITIEHVLEQLGYEKDRFSSWGSANFPLGAHQILERVVRNPGSLTPALRSQMGRACLFTDEPNPVVEPPEGYLKRRQDTYLLGQFDFVAVPARADFNAAFAPYTQASDGAKDCDGPDGYAGWFWVVHAAAPNIGESAQAEDFVAYSREELSSAATFPTNATNSSGSGVVCCWKDRPSRPVRRLDEAMYLGDMGRLWRSALLVMGKLQVQDAIFFPFGMGAFLRQLWQNDDRYSDPATFRRLKRRVAHELMAALAEVCAGGGEATGAAKGKVPKAKVPAPVGPPRLHICLVCVNAESIENHNCFVEAAAERAKTCPRLAEVVRFHRNVDSLDLAHQLSSSSGNGRMKVGLLNGANRKLCGNHWFQGGARFAIDENLHRRSASLARAALLLNFDIEARPRRPGQLGDTVRFLGGTVLSASSLNTGTALPAQVFSDGVPKPRNAWGTESADTQAAAPRCGGCKCCCKRRNPAAASSSSTQPGQDKAVTKDAVKEVEKAAPSSAASATKAAVPTAHAAAAASSSA